MRLKIGITGQPGFMGTFLFNFFSLKEKEYQLIPFQDYFYDDKKLLRTFATECDVIVHLAGMNRHGDPQMIYETNIRLTKDLIDVLEETNHKPHIIFSSSSQEDRDNPYGSSKKEARILWIKWAEKNNAPFTGLIIPNVFGPFGKPFYNSVISTFSWQLTHDQAPVIEVDSPIKLIYINDLVKIIEEKIIQGENNNECIVPYFAEKKVTEILEILSYYKKSYFETGIIPEMKTDFELQLFNTFRSYIDDTFFPVVLEKKTDDRGCLSEVIKTNTKGQMFYSLTRPGITRGNHFHARKIERFCVVEGEAIIKLRKIGTSKIKEYKVSGEHPAYVDMPVWFTHNITNTGTTDLLTLFWTNEIFDPQDPDTFHEKV